jgi:hypothetical protein
MTGHTESNFDNLSLRFGLMDRWLRKRGKTPKFKMTELELACMKQWYMSLEQCRSGDGVHVSVIAQAFFDRRVFAKKVHADNMIACMDTDRSGALSFEEFMDAVNGSNLLQSACLRKFIRVLATEYPTLAVLYSSDVSPDSPADIKIKIKPTPKTKEGALAPRIVPVAHDVRNLHFLKSRQTMMQMGIPFPVEGEEDKVTVSIRKCRSDDTMLRSHISISLLSPNLKICREYGSDSTYDRSSNNVPTYVFSPTRKESKFFLEDI